MFLDPLIKRNPQFVSAAVQLHRDGQIPPNCYVLDLDAMRQNARLISEKGHRLGLKVFAMTKQFGRNPPAIDAIAEGGVDGFVAVDMGCVLPIVHSGQSIGNLGHVVQIPNHEVPRASAADPDYWTIYSLHKAAEAAAASAAQGRVQKMLVRVYAPGDAFYPGQEGGFPASDIEQVLQVIGTLDGASVAGITTFPAIRYDQSAGTVEPAPNAKTLEDVANRLRDLGLENPEINAPGNTSCATLDLLASLGATQVEPGHGLTATTPLHAHRELDEQPAALYLSEVSHVHDGTAYCFGGGLYVDPVFPEYQMHAHAGGSADAVMNQRVTAQLPPMEGIDYYAMLDGSRLQPGDSVVFGFRMQAFVTRAYVAPVSGVTAGRPQVEGIWTTAGSQVNWPGYADYFAASENAA